MAGVDGKTEEQIQAFVDAGENTRFGGKNPNPSGYEVGLVPGSIRRNTRYLARQALTGEPGKFKLPLPKQPTAAQIIAAQEIEATANREGSDHQRRVEWLTEQLDGKLHQVNVNTDLEKIESMTEEELHEYNRRLDERIAAATRGTTGADGTQPPAGGDDAAGNAAPQGADRAPAREGERADESTPGAGSL